MQKRYRSHLFVGMLTVLRACARVRPTVLLGRGQGGLVLMCLSRPEVVERALIVRMVHPQELAPLREAWNDLRLILVEDVKATRGHSDLELLNSCVPELLMRQHREIPCITKVTPGPHKA